MSVLNADRPFGAVAVGTMSGSPWMAHLRRVNADGSTAIFRGDKVIHAGTGNRVGITVSVSNSANNITDGYLVGLMIAPVVDRTLPTTEHPGYCPATGSPDCLVVTARDLLMVSQEDGVGDMIPFTSLGQQTIDVTTTTGSTTTGRAQWELDGSSHASSTDGPVVLYGMYDSPDNLQGDDTSAPNGGGVVAGNRPKWIVYWQPRAHFLDAQVDI